MSSSADGRAMPDALPTVRCAGVSIAAVDADQAAAWVIDQAQRTSQHGRGAAVHLCNTYTLSLADGDDDYRALLNCADANFADGAPVVWVNRLTHRAAPARPHRVRGPGLFVDVLDRGRVEHVRHYLLGGAPETLSLLEQCIAERFPGAVVAGAESPPFRPLTPDELRDQDERIRSSGAQIVWVGLGTPKQDVETARLASSLPVVAVAIGAAFDFVAGTVPEAPEWMQRNGLEWAHRLAAEPRRLWKRYALGAPRFAKAVVTRRND